MMGNELASSRCWGEEKVSPEGDEKQSGGAPRRQGSRTAVTPRKAREAAKKGRGGRHRSRRCRLKSGDPYEGCKPADP